MSRKFSFWFLGILLVATFHVRIGFTTHNRTSTCPSNFSTGGPSRRDHVRCCFLTNSTNHTRIVPTKVFISTADRLRIAYYSIGALGLVFNGFVAFVLIFFDRSSKGSNNTSAFHIKHQSCMDALVAIFLLTTTMKEVNEYVEYKPGNFVDEFMCRVWFSKCLLWSSLVASTYSVIALNLDRYIAVTHPIFHKVKFSRKRIYSIVLSASCTAVGPIYNFSYVVPTGGIQENGECWVYSVWPVPSLQPFVGILTLIVQFFLPLLVIVIVYLKMIVALRTKIVPKVARSSSDDEHQVSTIEGPSCSARARQNDEQKDTETSGGTKARAKNKILKTAGLLSVCFVTCWSFNQIYFLLYHLNVGNLDLSGPFYHFTVIMVFANCCVNPIVYSLNFEPFQKNVKYLIVQMRRVVVSN